MEIRDTRNGEWFWVYNALLADPHLTTGEKLVYSAISTFGGHQVIHPTKEQIAARCALDEKTVQRAIKRLEEVGYMSMDKSTGRGNANVYYLLKKPKGCNLCPFIKGDIEDTKGGHLEPQKGTETTPHKDSKDSKDIVVAKAPTIVYSKESEEDTEREIQSRTIPLPYSPRTTREAWEQDELWLQVLAWFFTEKKLWAKADTKFKLQQMMARHKKAAKRIARAEWKKGELREAKAKAIFSPEMENEWTLETIEKYLTK